MVAGESSSAGAVVTNAKYMGLSISRSIVEPHSGRIWATANGDAGTTLTFTLPLASDGSA
jgi:signal transduction histidine kinase